MAKAALLELVGPRVGKSAGVTLMKFLFLGPVIQKVDGKKHTSKTIDWKSSKVSDEKNEKISY